MTEKQLIVFSLLWLAFMMGVDWITSRVFGVPPFANHLVTALMWGAVVAAEVRKLHRSCATK